MTSGGSTAFTREGYPVGEKLQRDTLHELMGALAFEYQ
jgi:hypothetical protein